MSKKHFQQVATALGLLLRETVDYPNGDTARAIHRAANVMADTCASINPLFDRGRFLDWIEDTAQGARDAQGRKVKVSA